MLRRVATGMLILGILTLHAGTAFADTFIYEPNPKHIENLPHGKYYTWGIDVSELEGWRILEAELQITRITNSDNGENTLFIHLLDEAELGVHRANDRNDDFVDAFEGNGVLIDEWHDANGAWRRDDISYLFSDLDILGDLTAYIVDGVVAFGFDPDCHFYNDGFKLVVTAERPTMATESTSWGDIKKTFR
ncbi:MAG: hypothetical protein JW958_10600 [Candidatus Eisenbacteria bacterium]|nr:hypothetical protein [Candidatus Eisenbacteria bacterium]